MQVHDSLAIEVTYRGGEVRVLMARWKLKETANWNSLSMFSVVAKCGCDADMDSFRPCSRHSDAATWRVIDATAPKGRRIPVH